MPHADFQPFSWVPTDRFWSDVIYVQDQNPKVINTAPDAPTRRNRSGPVRIVRHPNVCQRCQLQSVRSGVCLECDAVQKY
jgi:hypothetical protein